MKNLSFLMRAALLLILLAGTALTAAAYDFAAGGIYYNITSSTNMTAAVTYYNKNNNTYSGAVTIPTSVTYNGKTYYVTAIGDYAFVGCSGMTSITINASRLTSIGNYAFQGCNGLTTFNVPAKVTSIGNYAFNSCYGLSRVTFVATTSAISLGYGSSQGQGHGLFEDCLLNYVKIDRPLSYNTSSSYGYSPFARQEELTQIVLGQNVTSIPANLFYGNLGITTYTVPSHIKSIDDYAFNGFSGAKKITLTEGTERISNYAFNGCSSLTTLTIPSTVTSIGQNAFSYSGLKSIVIPPAVTSVGNSAFNGCTAMTGVTIEEGEQTLSLGYNYYNGSGVGKGLFYDCPLNSVFIGRSLSYSTRKYEGYSPFANNASLVKARFGNPVTSIQSYLFSGCTAFKKLEYNSLCAPISIDAYAFDRCTSLTESDIVFPNSVKTIGEGAFMSCTSLLGYTIPNHVVKVEAYAFQNCTKLANLVIKPSVTSIANYAFNGCISLSQLTVEEGEQTLSLGYNYYNGSGVGKGLFYDCPLNSVFIGRSLSYSTRKYEGYSPFANNVDLAKAKLGKKLASLQDYLFYGCINLNEVTACASTPPTANTNCFSNYDATLYVPKGSVSAYNNANVWKSFYSIVGIDIVDETMPGDVDGSGNVNIDDVTGLINYLLTNIASGINTTNADVDGDGVINIDDITALINKLLTGH